MSSYAPIDHRTPYGSGAPYYNESTGFINPVAAKKKTSPWIKIGIPVVVLLIIAGVVGGVVATRHKSSSSSSTKGSSPAAGTSAISQKNAAGHFATATDSYYMVPIYPSTTNTALYTTPTFISGNNAALNWPTDPFQPANPAPTAVRPDRPRLIAPAYKWAALPTLIANDPYLKTWNDTIFGNATSYYPLPPVVYHMDGGSGILDNSRETKMRLKAFSYVYRMTNDTKWSDRAWQELQNAAGNGSTPFGPNDGTKWNPSHFLDVAEMTAAFAIAYDWMYDSWTDDQKSQIRTSMIAYGLNAGITAFGADPAFTGWWKTTTYGNWNCVCNGGLTLGALAILGDDTSGIAEQILGSTVPSALTGCVYAPSFDGTWAETANYWYFGTTGHAEMASSLQTATGSDFGMFTTNPSFSLTGMYHMYAYGPTSLFDWGDHGPNKFSTTANAMFLYADAFQHPEYALFQRDRADAAEPWSMFWYDPSVAGAYWDGLALDHFFTNSTDQWASMRSSWTDINALYVGVKAGMLTGHQTHGDLDCGDFVIDAMGFRFAGEYGSANYLSTGYFSNETQESDRWIYFRKRTEGQNVIMVGGQNQVVGAAPTINFGTTNETQGSSTVYNPPSDSTAFFTADLASAYTNVNSYLRGVRTINGRKQVLVQDDITASAQIQWRIQTNATVTIDSSGSSAKLELMGKTTTMQILNAPSGAVISTVFPAARLSTDPAPPTTGPEDQDQANPTVTIVEITLPAGSYSLQVLFNPQWDGMKASDFVTPPSVPVGSWSLTSHN